MLATGMRTIMKRVIEGKTYNTDTATMIARYDYVDQNGYDTDVTVYQTKGGAFFAVHEWEVIIHNVYDHDEKKTKVYVEALSRDEVQRLVEKENLEILNDRALTLPPEAVDEPEKGATIYVRVPETLKAKVDEAAETAGVSTNAWALRCFESCLTRAD
jgi:predicted HicB family RNase H-like nuclease